MALSKIQMMTMIGISTVQARNAIIADFLSTGLDGLRYMTEEDVRSACTVYSKRTDPPFPIHLTPIQKMRLWSLVLWVKDRDRLGQPVEFPNGTEENTFLDSLNEALERERRRKSQKKEGESYLDGSFNTKLRSQKEWEKWTEELKTTLTQIIGVRGVPLIYVIREAEEPTYDGEKEFDDAVIDAITLDGPDFKQDSRTVHKILLKNIHDESDAYTYVKTLTKFRNGRMDIIALKERYSSEATKQTLINKAKTDLKNLVYKNERNFSFEKFSARLQKSYDELEDLGREVNNGDIVDELWDRIQASDIQMYVASLKVDYQRNQRDYKAILQDIAAEVGKKSPMGFSATRGISATYTRQGPCPTKGAYKDDGSLFIGKYTKDQWFDDTVKPHHEEIRKARSQDNGGGGGQDLSRKQKRKVNAVKRSNKKLKKLKSQIAAAKVQIAAAKITNGGESKTKDDAMEVKIVENNAGNSFGGKVTFK